MNLKIVFALVLLCAGLLYMQGERLKRCQAALADSKAELAKSQEREKQWLEAHDSIRAACNALKNQASSCLEREAAAMADAAQWQELLAKMELRQMSDKEREGVPDDTTRKALLDALDRPL